MPKDSLLTFCDKLVSRTVTAKLVIAHTIEGPSITTPTSSLTFLSPIVSLVRPGGRCTFAFEGVVTGDLLEYCFLLVVAPVPVVVVVPVPVSVPVVVPADHAIWRLYVRS